MKLIKPEFKIIEPTGYTIDDIYKSIELAGRVSHKSEDKITETSAKDFVGRMLNMKHLATCEFGTVYLNIPNRYEYSKETIKEFKKGLAILKKAYIYAQRIDWLLSGDDGEESFHERLKEELDNLKSKKNESTRIN